MNASSKTHDDASFSPATSLSRLGEQALELHGVELGPSTDHEELDTPWVVHVTAVTGRDRRVMIIDEQTPKSHADALALNLVRARADAIVITGQILRAEPELSYEPGRPGPSSEPLAQLAASLRALSPPILAILTRGDVPATHPVFRSRHVKPLLVGPRESLGAHDDAPAERAYTNDHEGEGLHAAIALLASRGARVIGIEAGPSVAAALYDDPGVDALSEICLSTYEGASLPESRLAGALPPIPTALELRHEVLVETGDGPWRFQRFVRTTRRGAPPSASRARSPRR